MTTLAVGLLLAKLIVSAAVVVAASLIIERSGPLIGALIASLPLSSGPVYIFLALEHGPVFIADTALASLPSMTGIAAFQLTYVYLARAWRTAPALGGALVVWLLVTLAVRATGLGFIALAGLAILAYGGAYAVVRPSLRWTGGGAPPRRWWDIPFRAAVVGLVTAAALLAGRLVGPAAAGVVALMPSVYVPLILILQPRIGGMNTGVVIGIALPGMIGLTLALCTVHLGAVPLGSVAALSLALFASMGWNLGLLWWKTRRR